MALAGVYTKMDMPQTWGLRNPGGISVLEVYIVKFFDINWIPVNWLGCLLIFWFFFQKEFYSLVDNLGINIIIYTVWFFMYFLGELPIIIGLVIFLGIFNFLYSYMVGLPSHLLNLLLMLANYLNIIIFIILFMYVVSIFSIVVKLPKEDRHIILKFLLCVFLGTQISVILVLDSIVVCILIIIIYSWLEYFGKVPKYWNYNIQMIFSQAILLDYFNLIIPWCFWPFWVNLVFIYFLFFISSDLGGWCWFRSFKKGKLVKKYTMYMLSIIIININKSVVCLISYKNTIIRTLMKNDSPRNWIPSQVSSEIKWESYIFKFCEFDWTLVNWLACLLIFWFFFPKELNKLREAWSVNLAITFMWFFLYFLGGLPVLISVHVSLVIFLGLRYMHTSLPSYWLTLALGLGIYLNIVVLACLGVLWLVVSYLLIKVEKSDRQLLLKLTSFIFIAVQISDILDSVWLTVCISSIILYVYGDKMSKIILSKGMQLLLSQVSFLAVLNIVIPWVFLPFWINLIFLNFMFFVSTYLWGWCWFTSLKNYKL